MARLSRRAFFHAIGLRSDSAEPKPDDVRVPSDSQKREEGGKSDAADVPGTFQFSLMSILVLITVVGILLGVAKTWPTKAPVAAVLAAVVLEWIYRKRIKVALGTKNYRRGEWMLERLFGAIGGGLIGVVVGFILSIFVFGTWLPVKVGGFLGLVLGIVFPRVAGGICDILFFLLPF